MIFRYRNRYLTFAILRELKRFNPDILILGGTGIPSNLIAYKWARLNNKYVKLFSEYFRIKSGNDKNNFLLKMIIGRMYNKIDAFLAAGDSVYAKNYFVDTIGFSEEIVCPVTYPVDLVGFPIRLDNRDTIRQVLFEHKIYPPLHCPIQDIVPGKFEDSHRLAAEIMTLPCDQSYDSSDMERMSRIVWEVLEW